MSSVFADKERVMPHVKSVMTSSIATGIGGIVGNKGGIGVSFLLRDTRLCFVNTHLAAHRDNVKARNSDFHEIRNRMEFSKLRHGQERKCVVFGEYYDDASRCCVLVW